MAHMLLMANTTQKQDRVVQKLVNSNPGLKVDQIINFSYIKMVFASFFSV